MKDLLSMSTKQYYVIVLVVVISLLASFFSGYFLKNLFTKPNTTTSKQNVQFYFSDEIILVAKDKPHYTLIAYTSRFPKDDTSYYHSQKVFLFDGKVWQSDSLDTATSSLDLPETPIIPKWEINVDPSLVLKQSVNGEVQIKDNKIDFDVPVLKNELGIRSLPDYTIFRSNSSGKLTINGKDYDSYVLYSRTYAYGDSVGLVAVTKPLGINTDYLAFWDTEGNFYNIDETTVKENANSNYKKHSIAIFEDKDEKVQKSFTLDVQKNAKAGYKINIFEKINRSLNVNFLNSVNKSVTPSPYNWFTGQIDGEVKLKDGRTIKGFGIYEQIYQ